MSRLRALVVVALAVGAAGVLHQAEPAPALLAIDAKVRPGHGKMHVQGKREHSKGPTREHSKAPTRKLTKVQAKARKSRHAKRLAKSRKNRHANLEGKTDIQGQKAKYPPEVPEEELEEEEEADEEEDEEQDEEEEQDQGEEEEQQERPLDLHATTGPAPLISSAVANSLGVDRATGAVANDVADSIRDNSVANAIAANAAIAVAAVDPVAAARRLAELQINAKLPSTRPLSWDPATGAATWEPTTKETEDTQEPPAPLAFASSPISSAFDDLLQSFGADKRKETSSTLSAVQAIRNAVGGASATHITAEDEAAVAEAHVDFREHPPMSDIEAGMPGLHGEKNPAQMLRFRSQLQKSASEAVGSASLVSKSAKPSYQKPWDASKFMEIAMSPAARNGRVKQDEFKDLVNQVRSSVSGQDVLDPTFEAIIDGSKQTAYQKLVTKMFSKVDEDAAAEATQPDALSSASPPPPDVSIDYPYPKDTDVGIVTAQPSASPSTPPPDLSIDYPDCLDCYPKGEEGNVQGGEPKEPSSRLEAERVVLADLDQPAWTGIPHLRENPTSNATSVSEEAPLWVPTKRLFGYTEPKEDTETPKRKQAEFRRLVERIKSGEISTKDAASHAANLFEDEESFRVAPNAADERRRAFRRAQRAGAHLPATPQPPIAAVEGVAPAATDNPKQSALAFNALVLAQRGKIAYKFPSLGPLQTPVGSPLDPAGSREARQIRARMRRPSSSVALLSPQSAAAPPLTPSAADAAPLRKLYVFGLDGAGTRYVSRALSKAVAPHSTWDGEEGFCKTTRGLDINHVSLPGGRSTSKSSKQVKQGCDGQMILVEHVDHCEHVALPTRWFANITTILENDPNAKGIIVTREKEARLHGALRTCPDRSMALAEMDFGQEQVDLALRAVPHQLLTAKYEDFGSDLEGQWRRIFNWVGFWMPASLEPFEPRNSE